MRRKRPFNGTTISLVVTSLAMLASGPGTTRANEPVFTAQAVADAEAIRASYEDILMTRKGVEGVGLTEKDGELAILVLTEEADSEEMPAEVDGMPLVVAPVGKIVAHQMNLGTSTGNPINCAGPNEPPPGNTGQFCDVGTSGFKVCDKTDAQLGGWITNNHVGVSGCPGKCPNLAAIGTDLRSPGVVDALATCSTAGTVNVGTLNRFVTLVLDSTTNNTVDAAFVQATDAQVSATIQGLGAQSNTIVAPFVGQVVCKSGRTSGVTCGTVTAINLTIDVTYDQAGTPSPGGCGATGVGRFINQVMYSPTAPSTVMSQPGDSGAPVVDAANNAVALNFAGDDAGDGFGNPIGAVVMQLQVALCSDTPDPPTSDADGDYTAECDGATTAIQLDGTGSSDPDPGDSLTFAWTTDCPGGSFSDASSATPVLTVSTGDECAVSCTASLTVTDRTGFAATDSAEVTIGDTTPPDITCPPDITVECDQSTAPEETGFATGVDICDPSVDIGFSDDVVPGTCIQESTITRTWTAGDSCGNEVTCEQVIQVVDTTPPAIECNAPTTITPPDAPISFTATSTDNCDGAPSVGTTDFRCFKFTKKGKEIDKGESCQIDLGSDTIHILDSGGVGDNIRWTVRSEDSCGNSAETECGVNVIRP